MAKLMARAVRRRANEEPRIELIPVVDDSVDDLSRRREVAALLAMMVMNAHRRGRPRKCDREEEAHAA